MAELEKSLYTPSGESERLPKPQEVTDIVFTALSSTGVEVSEFKDNKTIFIVKGSGDAVFKAGNTFAGREDLTVKASTTGVFVAIESAKFIDKETGKIKITGDSTASIAIVETR